MALRTVMLALAIISLSPTLAMADRKAADGCAAGLSAESQAIYAGTMAQNPTATTGRSIVVAQTKKLMAEGKLGDLQARPAAEAAGKCLELLR